MTTARRFPIRFTGINRLMWLAGVRASRAAVEVSGDRLRVRMGWGFHLDVPRGSVRSAVPDDGPVRAWGAHGRRGRWLVNGSSDRIVRLRLQPPGRARVAALLPARVRELRVSVEDPDGLIATLS